MARSALASVESRQVMRSTVSFKTISYGNVLTHVQCTPRSYHADVRERRLYHRPRVGLHCTVKAPSSRVRSVQGKISLRASQLHLAKCCRNPLVRQKNERN